MDLYEFKDGFLKIEDPELEISYQGSFSPLFLPKELIQMQMPSGHRLFIKHYVDGSYEALFKKNDKIDGQWILYYKDGSIKMSAFYLGGELHGPSYFFSDKGILLTESWFLFGKKEGKTHWFYASGMKNSLQRFKEGVWSGVQEYWYSDGTLKTVMNYRQGVLDGEVLLYHPHGSLKRKLLFKEGKPLNITQGE